MKTIKTGALVVLGCAAIVGLLFYAYAANMAVLSPLQITIMLIAPFVAFGLLVKRNKL